MTTVPFDHLLAAYASRASRAAYGFVRDEQEARELAQDALAKAWRARDPYDEAQPFYPWLYRIVRNTCLDALARRKHRPVVGLDVDRVAAGASSVEQEIDQASSDQRLRLALQTLSPEHQEILSMRHFQDLSYVEIGELLGLPEGTVMSRLFRARRALAQAIEPGGAR